MTKQPRPHEGPETERTFSGQDARQGEIILKRRWQRWIFAGGLAAIVVLLLLSQLHA